MVQMSGGGDQMRMFASLLGATGVGLGAFGAHGLKHKLIGSKLDNWKTAVSYQLLHAVALLALSAIVDKKMNLTTKSPTFVSYKTAGQCMGVGSILFSGSIYCLCLEIGPKKLMGPTTPLGGLLMIAGWTILGLVK